MERQDVSSPPFNAHALAMRVSIISIVSNVVLSGFKLLAGILANSSAMISDSIHSASDVLTTFIVIGGLYISKNKADSEHQYGHERMECIAALILAAILGLVGAAVGYSSYELLVSPEEGAIQTPGMLALIAAVVSIAVKEHMYWYTRAASIKTNSTSLMADAWHHRSDALSSVGALIGIAGARMGWPWLDPVAGIVICICIVKTACDIAKQAIDQLVDKSCNSETVEAIEKLVSAQPGVIGVDWLGTRQFAAKMYVDVEIRADGELSLSKAHSIAESVHDAIEKEFPTVKHCMVHVNPDCQ